MRKDAAELQRHLREKVSLLRTATVAFDSGDELQADPIATHLRVLLHDTDSSTSLLELLGIKSSLRFLDTSGLKASRTSALMAVGGLTWLEWKAGSHPKHIAPLDRAAVVASLPFNQWWSGLAVRVPDADTGKPRDFLRKDLVLIMANKDGGAHVADKIDRTYFDLTRNSSLGEVAVDGEVVENWNGNPVPAALRQMADEVIRTLEEQVPQLLR